MISIQHYHDKHGNIIHSNHGNGTQPNKDFIVFTKHQVNDYLLLSMAMDESRSPQCYMKQNNNNSKKCLQKKQKIKKKSLQNLKQHTRCFLI